MFELIEKENLSIEEIKKIDNYFDDNIEELLILDVDKIYSLINKIETTLTYSLAKITLEYHLFDEIINIKSHFTINLLDTLDKYYKILKMFNFEDVIGLSTFIGDVYFEIDKDKALSIYESIFTNTFNLNSFEYFNSLVNYLSFKENESIDILVNLLNIPIIENKYNIDLIKTYELLINKLGVEDDRYYEYLKRAIPLSISLAMEQQKENYKDLHYLLDEEVLTCELLVKEFDYLVNKKDYINAFTSFETLTTQIANADYRKLTRIRDLIYKKMIDYLKEDYAELEFLDSMDNLKIINIKDNFKDYLNEIITVENNKGLRFNFKVVNIHSDIKCVVRPILPIINSGKKEYYGIVNDNNEQYLKKDKWIY